ncbi:MAG: amidohydrolase [Ruminococcaceae bacterium]|nr:amidohydrolase [Oscillospiraceae bacterium]
MLLIKNGYIKTMAGPDLEQGCVLVDDNGKIAAVGTEIAAPEGASVIDAQGRLVTPGCVEAHCHIGLHNESLRWEGADYNESSDPITPQMRAIDSINPMDGYFADAIRGGVTSACAGPGSANVVGGTFAAFKLYGKRIDKMIIKEPIGMKCAFGENPKNSFGQSAKKAPKTRMAVAALLRELLFKAREYQQQKDAGKEPKFDMKLEAMLPVMRKQIPLKCHVHRADDILTAIRIAKEFDVKLTLDHCTEGHLIAQELAEEGYTAFCGPTLSSKSKPELRNKSFETAGVLHKAGVPICIVTDAPVITLENLPMCAGLAVAAGLPYEEGWRAITINPAVATGIADRVGSLEVGKDADLVIWTADPLTAVGAHAAVTLIDGKVVYEDQ